jgi:hypothetical protein
MTDFYATWELVRGRFDEAVLPLNHAQLSWRLQPGALTLGETAIHVAGVELWFVGQLLDEDPEIDATIKAAARDGVINEKPFPLGPGEITPDLVREVLAKAREKAAPVLRDPDTRLLQTEILSALGPVITGHGALARLAYHPGYHQGQAHLIKSAPGFPPA